MKFLQKLFRDLSRYLDRPDFDEKNLGRRLEEVGSRVASTIPFTR